MTRDKLVELLRDHFPIVNYEDLVAWCECGKDLAWPPDKEWAEHVAELIAWEFDQ